jgi:5-(carboxyamino)imidazole ribonucleotide mutase
VAKPKESKQALVGLIMGSKSDWETMKQAADMLDLLEIPYEKRVISAHRAPELLREYCHSAQERGLKVIIAGAGGAAHLAGVTAAQTTLPVLGVPMQSSALNGLDSLLSTVQMPKGIPVGTLAIGPAGAANAGLFAAAILALSDPALARRLQTFREQQTKTILETSLEG